MHQTILGVAVSLTKQAGFELGVAAAQSHSSRICCWLACLRINCLFVMIITQSLIKKEAGKARCGWSVGGRRPTDPARFGIAHFYLKRFKLKYWLTKIQMHIHWFEIVKLEHILKQNNSKRLLKVLFKYIPPKIAQNWP